jgi:uncharacterized membrane protein
MNALRTAALATAAASGVMGGVLFGFSSFVMPALRRLPASHAVTTMQALTERLPARLGCRSSSPDRAPRPSLPGH